MIQLRDVSFSYDKKEPVLRNVNIEINKGESMVLTGENGSGKTTFSKLLNGLIIPDSGDVIVDGMNTRDEGSLNEIRKKTAVLFTNPDNQIFSATAEEDIAFGLENLRLESKEIRNRISYIAELMDISEILNIPVNFLSAGEKIKVVLAGILAGKPDYIILDNSELLPGKDGIDNIPELARDANGKTNPAIVYVTQYEEYTRLGLKTIKLENGNAL